MTGAILHMVNDAAMTYCDFLAIGCLTYRLKSDQFEALQGAFERMPFSMAGLLAGGVAFIGIPPTCGFFSKWYLLKGGMAAGHWGFVGALLFSSLMTALMVFRIVEHGFFQTAAHGHGHHRSSAIREAPTGMVISLLGAALVLLLLGFSSGQIVTRLIEPLLAGIMP
jgi:multicomponent Na+:H+ antiporter subunit D